MDAVPSGPASRQEDEITRAVYFDERYVGNPLVYCGTVGVLPADKVEMFRIGG